MTWDDRNVYPQPRARRGPALVTVATVAAGFLLALAGAGVDMATGDGLRWVFAAAFVAAALLMALLSDRERLSVPVTATPLVYAAVAVVAAAVSTRNAPGSGLSRIGLETVTTLVIQAPVLIVGTGLALVVALTRRWARSGASRRGALPSRDEAPSATRR